MTFKLGELIYSNAGRDVGRRFIITNIIDEKYVLISDGDLRKIEKPKKKKIKHIKTCGIIIDSLNKKMENKEKITNAEIRKMIAQYVQNMESHKENKEG
ncbi:MAG TPA: RNA-binding protein [Clostridiaceae bacterium]|jgi:large subunit ribosomal protein L14e|nr:RNA-binding protein [Clostridiaceae bacterium]